MDRKPFKGLDSLSDVFMAMKGKADTTPLTLKENTPVKENMDVSKRGEEMTKVFVSENG